jgi:hypothetical protein
MGASRQVILSKAIGTEAATCDCGTALIPPCPRSQQPGGGRLRCGTAECRASIEMRRRLCPPGRMGKSPSPGGSILTN